MRKRQKSWYWLFSLNIHEERSEEFLTSRLLDKKTRSIICDTHRDRFDNRNKLAGSGRKLFGICKCGESAELTFTRRYKRCGMFQKAYLLFLPVRLRFYSLSHLSLFFSLVFSILINLFNILSLQFRDDHGSPQFPYSLTLNCPVFFVKNGECF